MAILLNQLPANWVVRDLGERDYGIDLVIELDREGQMVGDMIVAQVKSLKTKPFRGATGLYKGLRTETMRYLLAQPAPAYLFVVSTGEQRIFWRSLREHNRERAEGVGSTTIELRSALDLSEAGTIAFLISQLREKAWPDVERAVVAALMFYNALGPLYLACKRFPANSPIPSSVQQLLIAHFEYNVLIQRYVLGSGRRYRHLPEYYDEALAEKAFSRNLTFTGAFAIRFLKEFIGDYLKAIEFCDRMVRDKQRPYWFGKYVYHVAHLDAFPPYFVDEDWYARYYFDEFESETRHINLDFFTDVSGATRHDFRLFMNGPDGFTEDG